MLDPQFWPSRCKWIANWPSSRLIWQRLELKLKQALGKEI